VYQMSDGLASDIAKGELRILGKRHAAIDVKAFCEQLDLMVGVKVAEVIMNQHQFRLGKEDASTARAERPKASVKEIVDSFAKADSVSGFGVTKVVIPETPSGPVGLTISNPCLTRTGGASKALLFSYWCGIFSQLYGVEYKAEDVTYDKNLDLLKCQIIPK